jgi:hypothetical protein
MTNNYLLVALLAAIMIYPLGAESKAEDYLPMEITKSDAIIKMYKKAGGWKANTLKISPMVNRNGEWGREGKWGRFSRININLHI